MFARKITRRTPGRFLTRVLGRGVEPAILIRYKHSKLKQYFKEGQALRTETTINDTKDFGVGRSKGIIRRIPKSQRYELTDHGRRIAVFFTKTYTRILNPSLTELDPPSPTRSPRATPSHAPGAVAQALEARIADAAITA